MFQKNRFPSGWGNILVFAPNEDKSSGIQMQIDVDLEDESVLCVLIDRRMILLFIPLRFRLLNVRKFILSIFYV